MFSLINRIKELYQPLADCKRSYGVYSDGDGNFQIRAVGDNDVFVVADGIPACMMAELIAELLNMVAGVAGTNVAKPTPKPRESSGSSDGWLDRLIRRGEDQIRAKDRH